MLAAALYLGLAALSWRRRWRGPVLDRPPVGLATWERAGLLVALLAHGTTLVREIFPGDAMHFSFSIAVSMILWLAIAFYWIESFYARMDGLQMLGLPVAAVAVMLPSIFPAQHLLANAHSMEFRAHFLVAMLAYSLFTLAALYAVLMSIVERKLHQNALNSSLARLPPLLAMEGLLFHLIFLAFVLLTLVLGSGILFSEEIFGKPLIFDHKTLFGVASWLVFAALLLGRRIYGWRGRIALRWTITGFVFLLLAYVGSRFVTEVLLGRV